MSHRRHRNRATRSIGVVIGAAVVVAATLPVGPGAAQPSGLEVPAGDWNGWLTFVAATPDGTSGAGSGDFTMQSTDGDLTGAASWVFDAALAAGGTARADVTAAVQGASSAPQLQVTSIVVNGTAAPVGASDPPIQLTITTASCEMVTGSGSGVGIVTAFGDWVAVRDGSFAGDPAAFQRELAALTVSIEAIEADLLAGRDPDRWELFAAIFAAERLSQALTASPDCGGPRAGHSAVAVGLIADLLAKLVDAGTGVGTQWFVDLVLAAVEVGAIGAGASGPEAEELEADVIAEIQFRIDEAVDASDDDALPRTGLALVPDGIPIARGRSPGRTRGAGSMMIRRTIITAVIAGLLATSCSSDDRSDSVDDTTPTATDDPAPATTDEPDDPPDTDPPATDPPATDPPATDAPPDTEPAGATPAIAEVLGVATIEIVTPPSGGGERPLLEWTAVEGAGEYNAVALTAEGRPYWAWVGQTNSIVFGGGEATGDAGQLATVFEPLTWTVAAYDADGTLLALSAPSPLAP